MHLLRMHNRRSLRIFTTVSILLGLMAQFVLPYPAKAETPDIWVPGDGSLTQNRLDGRYHIPDSEAPAIVYDNEGTKQVLIVYDTSVFFGLWGWSNMGSFDGRRDADPVNAACSLIEEAADVSIGTSTCRSDQLLEVLTNRVVPFDAIVLLSTQHPDYYSNISACSEALSRYVEDGGSLVINLFPNGADTARTQVPEAFSLPFAARFVRQVTDDVTLNTTGSLETTQNDLAWGMDDAYLSGWNESAAGYLGNLPAKTRVVAWQAGRSSKPTLIETSVGDGRVIQSSMPAELAYGIGNAAHWVPPVFNRNAGRRGQLLLNELTCALALPHVPEPLPPVGGGGETGDGDWGLDDEDESHIGRGPASTLPKVVMVVSGLNSNTSKASDELRQLATRFWAEGYVACVVPASPGVVGDAPNTVIKSWDSITANATRLRSYYSEQLRFPPERRVYVVAHSMGGLFTREWMSNESFAGLARPQEVFQLATPNRGSPVADAHREKRLPYGKLVSLFVAAGFLPPAWTPAVEDLTTGQMANYNKSVANEVSKAPVTRYIGTSYPAASIPADALTFLPLTKRPVFTVINRMAFGSEPNDFVVGKSSALGGAGIDWGGGYVRQPVNAAHNNACGLRTGYTVPVAHSIIPGDNDVLGVFDDICVGIGDPTPTQAAAHLVEPETSNLDIGGSDLIALQSITVGPDDTVSVPLKLDGPATVIASADTRFGISSDVELQPLMAHESTAPVTIDGATCVVASLVPMGQEDCVVSLSNPEATAVDVSLAVHAKSGAALHVDTEPAVSAGAETTVTAWIGEDAPMLGGVYRATFGGPTAALHDDGVSPDYVAHDGVASGLLLSPSASGDATLTVNGFAEGQMRTDVVTVDIYGDWATLRSNGRLALSGGSAVSTVTAEIGVDAGAPGVYQVSGELWGQDSGYLTAMASEPKPLTGDSTVTLTVSLGDLWERLSKMPERTELRNVRLTRMDSPSGEVECDKREAIPLDGIVDRRSLAYERIDVIPDAEVTSAGHIVFTGMAVTSPSTIQSIEYSLNLGRTWQPVASTTGHGGAEASFSFEISGFGEGLLRPIVRVVRSDGTTTPWERSGGTRVVVDRTAPTTFTPEIVGVPAASEDETTTFHWTLVNDPAVPSAPVSFDCSVDGEQADTLTGWDATLQVTGLAPGAHELRIDATDGAGNSGDPVVFEFKVGPRPKPTALSASQSGPHEISTSWENPEPEIPVQTVELLCQRSGEETFNPVWVDVGMDTNHRFVVPVVTSETTFEISARCVFADGTRSAAASTTATVEPAANIAGRVRGLGSQMLGGIVVSAWRESNGVWQVEQTTTSTAGVFDFDSRLSPGAYRLSFHDPTGRHADAFYQGASTVTEARTVTTYAELPGSAEQTLQQVTGNITGRIVGTDAQGLSGAVLTAYRDVEGAWLPTAECITTDTGAYEFDWRLPPGNYRLGVHDPLGRVPDQYDGALKISEASTVRVYTASAGFRSIVVMGWTIGGVVRDADTGQSLASPGQVDLYSLTLGNGAANGWIHESSVIADGDGVYEFSDVIANKTYRITHRGCSYPDGGPISRGADVVFDADTPLTSHDIPYREGGTISGTASGFAPGGLAFVQLLQADRVTGDWQPVGYTFAGCGGPFTFSNLRPGVYRLCLDPPYLSGQDTIYYPSALSVETAQDIVVTRGGTRTGVDLSALPPSATRVEVDGFVFDGEDQPIDKVSVYLVRVAGRDVYCEIETETDASGAYSFDSVRPGVYRIAVSHPEFATSYFGTNIGTDIDIGLEPVHLPDIALKSPNQLIVDVNGELVDAEDGYWVSALPVGSGENDVSWWGAEAGQDGIAVIESLPEGDYILWGGTYSGNQSTYYEGTTVFAAAAPIHVGPSGTSAELTLVDEEDLGNTGVKGIVRDSLNRLVRGGVTVVAYQLHGGKWVDVGVAEVDRLGAYSLSGIQPGETKLKFIDTVGDLGVVWFGGREIETATSVDVVAGEFVQADLRFVGDTIAPLTTVNGATDDWLISAFLTLISQDAESPEVPTIYYTLNGGTRQAYSAPITISDEGSHTLSYWAVDAVGNTEQPKSATVRIDRTAPITTIQQVPETTPSGVYDLVATDALSGVAFVEYRVDDDEWAVGTRVTVTGSGAHVITYRAVDNAGNHEEERTYEPEPLGPSTTGGLTFSARQPAPFSATTGPATSASVRADGNGLVLDHSRLTVFVDGIPCPAWLYLDVLGTEEIWDESAGEWYLDTLYDHTKGTVRFSMPILPVGIHSVTVSVGTQAEAISSTEWLFTKVADSVAPVSSINPMESGWTDESVSLVLAATDTIDTGALSPEPPTIYYSLDGGIRQDYSVPIFVSTEGSHTLKYWAVDAAGNTEQPKSLTMHIDLTAPLTTIRRVSGSTTSTVYELRPTDKLSGVGTVKYRVDDGEWATGTRIETGPGVHLITYRAVDNAGNYEEEKVYEPDSVGGPTFSAFSPVADTRLTMNSWIQVSGVVQDPDGVDESSVRVLFNGTTVDPEQVSVQLRPISREVRTWDEEQEEWKTETIVDGYDDSYAIVSANWKPDYSIVPDRPAISVVAHDKLDNESTHDWLLRYDLAPTFSQLTPASCSTVRTALPNINLKITDLGGLASDAATLTIDGQVVPGRLEPATGILAYTVPTPLMPGNHSVTATAADIAGNIGTKTWTFAVPPEAGMTFSAVQPAQLGAVTGQITSGSLHVDGNGLALDHSNVTVLVDGVPCAAWLSHDVTCTEEIWDEYWQEWYIDTLYDLTKGTVRFSLPNLATGIHSVVVSASTQSGRVSSTGWLFEKVN